jgi:acyl-CoA synthetase (AMP-forming)/AMP-acid ligase II
MEVRIVDNDGSLLPESHVGHIQVAGDPVTPGYYKKEEDTLLAFDENWLRTGDMGFYFEGNLYISGRHKDIIFVNGRNYFAHDLENLANSLEGVNYGKIIFGGLTDPRTGKEKVIAFLSGTIDSAGMEMLHKLRVLLRKNLGIQLDELILIRSNEIPRTSSGKIQRYQLIRQYLHGDFRERRFH